MSLPKSEFLSIENVRDMREILKVDAHLLMWMKLKFWERVMRVFAWAVGTFYSVNKVVTLIAK